MGSFIALLTHMKNSLLIILLFTLSLLSIKSFSQDLITQSYSIKEGLLSNEVYDVKQGINGYIWVASSLGLQKFDGRKFTKINLDTIDDDPVVRLYVDYKQRLWGITFTHHLIQIRNDSILIHPQNELLRKLSYAATYSMTMDSNDVMWINNTSNLAEFKVTKDTIIRTQYDYKTEDYYYAYFRKVGNELSIAKGGNQNHSLTIPSRTHKTEDGFYVETSLIDNGYIRFALGQQLDEESSVISIGSKLMLIRNNKIITEFEPMKSQHIVDLYIDHKKRVWVSVIGQGVYVYSDLEKQTKEVFLPKRSISKIYQDRENNYWLALLQGGLVFFESTSSILYETETETPIIGGVEKDGDYFFINNKSIFKLNTKSSQIEKLHTLKNNDYFNTIYTHDNALWLGGNKFYIYENNKMRKFPRTCNGFALMPNNTLAMGCSSTGIAFFNWKTNIMQHNFFQVEQHINDIEYLQDTLWVGTYKGLFYLKENKLVAQHYDFDHHISTLKANNDELWIGTTNHGLFLKSKGHFYEVDNSLKTKGTSIQSIYIENDSITWVITNIGLTKIIYDTEVPYFNFENFFLPDYVANSEITSITKIGDYYWLSSEKGIVRIQQKDINTKVIKPQLTLTRLVHEQQSETDFSSILLPFDHNDIDFYFNAIQFKNKDQLKYIFKIDDVDKGYKTSYNNSCSYYNLPSGNHTFRIRAINANGLFSDEITVRFTIKKHFTKSVWFWLSISLVMLLIAIFWFWRWNRRRKILFTQEKELIKSELKAFKSQMNPHFIFNSMNAIQNLVLSEDTESAYEYLSQFSVLMRSTLNYSQKHKISIQEEINFLNTYLDIETLRFTNKFVYQIETDPKIDTNFLQIPPFLLQPLLENAVIHGLSPKPSSGFLLLKFILLPEYLEIHIKDNGIGRKKSEELNKIRKDHNSTGISNIQDRIYLLNQVSENQISFEIIDLYEDGKAAGTLIKLQFPLT